MLFYLIDRNILDFNKKVSYIFIFVGGHLDC